VTGRLRMAGPQLEQAVSHLAMRSREQCIGWSAALVSHTSTESRADQTRAARDAARGGGSAAVPRAVSGLPEPRLLQASLKR
jgi:hypothetical protein